VLQSRPMLFVFLIEMFKNLRCRWSHRGLWERNGEELIEGGNALRVDYYCPECSQEVSSVEKPRGEEWPETL
jgi:hypothetical protein